MKTGRALVEALLRQAAADEGMKVTEVEWARSREEFRRRQWILIFRLNGDPRELTFTSRELENCAPSSEVRAAVAGRLKRLIRSGQQRRIGF